LFIHSKVIQRSPFAAAGTSTGQAAQAAADELGPLPAKEQTMLTTFLGQDKARFEQGNSSITIPPLPHYHYHCDHPKLGETYIGHGNHPKLAIHLEASGQGQLRGPWNLLLPAERLDMYCGLRREVDWRI
jgi:hypothetical protein